MAGHLHRCATRIHNQRLAILCRLRRPLTDASFFLNAHTGFFVKGKVVQIVIHQRGPAVRTDQQIPIIQHLEILTDRDLRDIQFAAELGHSGMPVDLQNVKNAFLALVALIEGIRTGSSMVAK